MENEVVIGSIYRHFKGNIYRVINIAINTETLEKMVIYEECSNTRKVWARPLSMFVDKVDKQKYPNATQLFRFEKIDKEEL